MSRNKLIIGCCPLSSLQVSPRESRAFGRRNGIQHEKKVRIVSWQLMGCMHFTTGAYFVSCTQIHVILPQSGQDGLCLLPPDTLDTIPNYIEEQDGRASGMNLTLYANSLAITRIHLQHTYTLTFQALDYALEDLSLPSPSLSALPELLRLLCLLPYLEGIGGVYDRPLVVRTAEAVQKALQVLKVTNRLGVAVSFMAQSFFSPAVTTKEREACVYLVRIWG